MTPVLLNFLDQATPQQVRDLPADHLITLVKGMHSMTELAKRRRQVLEDGLQLKYLEAALRSLKRTGRDTGLTRFKDGLYTIVAEIPKKVIWNQQKLLHVLEQLPLDQRFKYVKTTYGVDERQYISWSDPLKNLFAQARLLKTGKPTFQLEGEEQ